MLEDSGSMEMGQKAPREDGALTLEWAARLKGIFLTGGMVDRRTRVPEGTLMIWCSWKSGWDKA